MKSLADILPTNLFKVDLERNVIFVFKENTWIPFFFLIENVYYMHINIGVVKGVKKILPILKKQNIKFYFLSEICYNGGCPSPFVFDDKLYSIHKIIKSYLLENLTIGFELFLFDVFEKCGYNFIDLLFSYLYDFDYIDDTRKTMETNKFERDVFNIYNYDSYGQAFISEKVSRTNPKYVFTTNSIKSAFNDYVRKENMKFLI